jgi:hypothetical protein
MDCNRCPRPWSRPVSWDRRPGEHRESNCLQSMSYVKRLAQLQHYRALGDIGYKPIPELIPRIHPRTRGGPDFDHLPGRIGSVAVSERIPEARRTPERVGQPSLWFVGGRGGVYRAEHPPGRRTKQLWETEPWVTMLPSLQLAFSGLIRA